MTDEELLTELDKRFKDLKTYINAGFWGLFGSLMVILVLVIMVSASAHGSTLPTAPLPDWSDLPAGTSFAFDTQALQIAIQNFPQDEVGEANGLIWYEGLVRNEVIFSVIGEPVPYLATGVDPPCEWGCEPIVERHRHPRNPPVVTPEPRGYGYLAVIAGGLVWIFRGRKRR